MGKFVITTRINGEYQFVLKAGNNETILTSEGYKTKSACIAGISSVKENAPNDARYERKNASNGKCYFNLKASNGQVIGTSQMYETAQGRDGGIESVKVNAPYAETDDRT